MIDRYTKAVLTVIASALIYLCIVLTPWPGVAAQTAQRPGDPTGPGEMVIVGWRGAPGESIPISSPAPLPVAVSGSVQVTGRVIAEKAGDRADRVVLVGWEDGGSRDGKPARPMQPFSLTASLPVDVKR